MGQAKSRSNNMSGGGGEDRLKTINREVQGEGGNFDEATPWLALESNPEILNAFAYKIGLEDGYEFVDVLAPELIEDHSKVKALVLLFPCTERIYEFRSKEEAHIRQKNLENYLEQSKHMFFLEQISAFGNACGTIATLHVLCNVDAVKGDSAIASFKKKTEKLKPNEIGKVLVNEPSLKASSDVAAESEVAQTACPSRDGPDLDHHFVAFVKDQKDQLWELDGTKIEPILHKQATSKHTFFNDAMQVVRQNFMQLEPALIEFSLCALVEKSGVDE